MLGLHFATSCLHGILALPELPILVTLNSNFCLSSKVRLQKAVQLSLSPTPLANWQIPERKKWYSVKSTSVHFFSLQNVGFSSPGCLGSPLMSSNSWFLYFIQTYLVQPNVKSPFQQIILMTVQYSIIWLYILYLTQPPELGLRLFRKV